MAQKGEHPMRWERLARDSLETRSGDFVTSLLIVSGISSLRSGRCHHSQEAVPTVQLQFARCLRHCARDAEGQIPQTSIKVEGNDVDAVARNRVNPKKPNSRLFRVSRDLQKQQKIREKSISGLQIVSNLSLQTVSPSALELLHRSEHNNCQSGESDTPYDPIVIREVGERDLFAVDDMAAKFYGRRRFVTTAALRTSALVNRALRHENPARREHPKVYHEPTAWKLELKTLAALVTNLASTNEPARKEQKTSVFDARFGIAQVPTKLGAALANQSVAMDGTKAQEEASLRLPTNDDLQSSNVTFNLISSKRTQTQDSGRFSRGLSLRSKIEPQGISATTYLITMLLFTKLGLHVTPQQEMLPFTQSRLPLSTRWIILESVVSKE
ncbi:hypothetical protein BJ138DRAFT_1183222 [Hygrophoropsis aurantiaca]|uniref:Uncharacterized protein n=1 Tax=Hygrophoropsis aurantiaca TaxID=72124 RepID=A0ACB8A0V5_9AGAM|nr:hypothetical protein BJ138DRAFT_1183222 [Hygrophoropsis aurantiaca]